MSGDFALFDKLDTDGDAGVSLLEWHTFMRATYKEKGATKAVKWVTTLLHTLRQVASGDEGDGVPVADAPVVSNTAPTEGALSSELRQDAVDVFGPLAALHSNDRGAHDTVSKAEFVAAQQGDFGIFSKMDLGLLLPLSLAIAISVALTPHPNLCIHERIHTFTVLRQMTTAR